ncbi:MAG TPA: hypothetical protein VNA28_06425 [Solirubrobacteraceae bacterium]|nr:hypothetical protein [Solirubrobacteraceae bacterium]
MYSSGDGSDAGHGSAIEALAPVIRLHPVRIKVITTDAAYRERVWKVLSDLGRVSFVVSSLDSPDDIASVLRAEPADVVLLDATGCEAAARKVIAKLADTAPRTGVLVVCHHCTEAARELRALPKWGWTQDLRAGVEVAYRAGNPLYEGPLGPLRRRPERLTGPRRLE